MIIQEKPGYRGVSGLQESVARAAGDAAVPNLEEAEKGLA